MSEYEYRVQTLLLRLLENQTDLADLIVRGAAPSLERDMRNDLIDRAQQMIRATHSTIERVVA